MGISAEKVHFEILCVSGEAPTGTPWAHRKILLNIPSKEALLLCCKLGQLNITYPTDNYQKFLSL